MEYYEFNTFKFFRRYYNLPRSLKLQWCVVSERIGQEEPRLRLGILLENGLYIDVAARCFLSLISCPAVKRTAWAARRISQGDAYCYQAVENGAQIILHKQVIADWYSNSWYTADTPHMRFL